MADLKSKLKNYKHCLWALYLVLYMIMFTYTQNMEKDHYWISHAPLDDAIPFVKEFILAYYAWFPFLIGFGIYFMFFSPDSFKGFMKMIAITFTVDIIFFIAFPSAIDFRPETVEGNDIFAVMTRLIYSVDRCRNVFPSGHVVGSMAAMFAVCECREIKFIWIKFGSVILAVLICLSTVYVKQHSVLDIYSGLVSGVLAYVIVYFSRIKERIKKLLGKKEQDPTE